MTRFLPGEFASERLSLLQYPIFREAKYRQTILVFSVGSVTTVTIPDGKLS